MVTRYERVVLALEDRFSKPTAVAAGASKNLERSLNDLDGTSQRTQRSITGLEKPIVNIDRGGRLADRSINQLTGRLRLLAEAALVLGPAIVPLGGAGLVAVGGLAAQFGALAGGIGVAAVALNGIGDALTALREYELEPTADNLEAMREELRGLDQAGRDFVMLLNGLGPELRELQDTARAGFLPGLGEGIEALMQLGPQAEVIIGNIAAALGDLAEGSGEALAGERYAGFFDYIEAEAGPLLMDFGRTVGNITETMANLMVAFSPASQDFSTGLAEMTERLAAWSQGLERDQSFQSFLAYIRENGPAAVELLGSLVRALAAVVEAAAPLGSALLPILTQLADAFSAIASSPIGPPLLTAAAALVTLNRALTVTDALMTRVQARGGLSAALGGKSSSGGGFLAVGARGATGILAVAGAVTMLGNALADATGAKVDPAKLGEDLDRIARGESADLLGRLADDVKILGSLPSKVGEPVSELLSGLGLFGNTGRDNAAENITMTDEALKGMIETGRRAKAERIFEGIAAELNGLPVGASLSQDALDDTMALFPEYASAAGQAASATRRQSDAARESARASREEAQALQAAVTAMEAKRLAALAAFDAETQYRQALVAARDAAKRNEAGIRGNSQAALENRSALSQLAAAWNGQSKAVRNNEERFRAARGAFIDAAEGMGVSEDAAKDLADRLLNIPKSRVTDVEVTGFESARNVVAGIRGELASLKDETVNIWVTRRTVNASPGMGPVEDVPLRRASGGTVPGPRYPYRDSVHALLAPFEEVVANNRGQADRHRALLKAVNSGNDDAVLSVMRRYQQQAASRGGVATAPTVHVAAPDLSALEQRLARIEIAITAADQGNREELRRNGAAVAHATGAPLRLGAQRAASWGGG